jgi:hypothetical protein
MTFIQRSTPSALQGRVSSTVDVLTSTPQSLSIAVGAAMLAVVGYQVLLAVVAIVSCGAGLWLITRPEQRATWTTPSLDVDLAQISLDQTATVPTTRE